MEMIENEFTLPAGNIQFFISDPQPTHFQHPQQQMYHFPMSYIPSPQIQPHQYYFVPSAELCQKVLGKSVGGKRKRGSKGAAPEGLNQSDVIHVRAKRGQATDSHSLAERVRRKKINEKLKSLHDIVLTTGMAVMLDEGINYIQSLQNQIEFLSMKLLTASLFHNVNTLDMGAVEIMQGPRKMAAVQKWSGMGQKGMEGGPRTSTPHCFHKKASEINEGE